MIKTIDKKRKINKSNKDLKKLVNDKVVDNIKKNLIDIIDNKLEGININDMIDDNVTKVKHRKKTERKIDEKLKEDVKYVFDNFMNNQKIIDYELINKKMKEIELMCGKRLNEIEDNTEPNNYINNNVSNKINGSDSMSNTNEKKLIVNKMIN